MNCRQLEERLERLIAGDLADDERERCTRHLSTCTSCSDLVSLARISERRAETEETALPADLLRGILDRTTGNACTAAHERLNDYVARQLSEVDGELVEAHLGDCSECRALAGALAALATDLPRLADLEPGPGFVTAVLRRTLPWRVRLRRWWALSWPRWVRRPRFAVEVAYVATLVLVLIFATPGSPLEAMPQRAVELVRTQPTTDFGGPVERLHTRVAAGLDTLKSSEGADAVLTSWKRTLELGSQAVTRSSEIFDGVKEKVRTFWDQGASLLQEADETPSTADENTDEETS